MQAVDLRVADIAVSLGLSVTQAWDFASALETDYIDKPKRWTGKKHRPLVDVRYKAKARLKRLHDFIQRRRLFHRFAQGSIRCRGSVRSARIHAGRPCVWTVDVKDCYPSIGRWLFRSELERTGFSPEVAHLLSLLAVRPTGIPQGSPIGTDAVNLFFLGVDEKLAAFVRTQDLRYTRVVDDFVFSARSLEPGFQVVSILETELQRLELDINQKKSAEAGYQSRPDEILVHSLSVSAGPGIAISTEEARSIALEAEAYVQSCRSITADSFETIAARHRRISGRLSRSRQMDFGPSRHIKRLLEAGDMRVLRFLRNARITSKNNRWWYRNKLTGTDEPKRIRKLLQRCIDE